MGRRTSEDRSPPDWIAELVLEPASPDPLYLQLADALKAVIARNRLPAGTAVPSERNLAERLDCHRNTVHAAYAALMEGGYFFREEGRRRVVVAESAAERWRPSFPAIGILLPGGFQRFLNMANRAVLSYLAGVVDRATQHQHSISLLTLPPTGSGPDTHVSWRESFLSRTSGLVYLSGHEIPHTPLEPVLDDVRIPQVYVSGTSQRSHISSVLADIQPGAQAAAALLRDCGHRRVGLLCSDWGKEPASDFQAAARLRPEVMRAQFQEAGLAVRREWIAEHSRGEAAMERELARILSLAERPSAFWCQNDEMAFQALDALRRRGLAVPGDVSLIGFDDIESEQAGEPFLTTIRQPRQAMGEQAVDLAIKLYELGVLGASRHVTVPTSLVVRSSVGQARDRPLLRGRGRTGGNKA